jgi:arylsulfatase
MNVWREPFVVLRMLKLFNLRADLFEQADNHTMGYDRWMAEHFS